MQIAMCLYSGLGLSAERMLFLRRAVEIYMLFSNRNMDSCHTPATLSVLQDAITEWIQLAKGILDPFVASLVAAGKSTAGYSVHIPKIHAMWHMLAKIPDMGVMQFYSTEG